MAVGTFFDGTNDEIVSNTGNDITSGAFTLAVMVYNTAATSQRTIVSFQNGTNPNPRLVFDSTSNLAIEGNGGDFPPWFTAVGSASWFLVVITKAAGNVAPKAYVTSDGSTWVKDGAAADAGTLPDPVSTISEVRLGSHNSTTFWNGDIAAVAYANTEANAATAKGLVDFANWSTLTNLRYFTGGTMASGGTVTDSAGGNSETSRVGATVGAQTVPSWFLNWPSPGAPTAPPNTAGTPPYPYVVEAIGSTLTTSRSPSVTFTATPQPGDWVVLFPSSTVNAVGVTMPSGWVNPLGGTTDSESDANEIAVGAHAVTAAESAAGTKTYTATNFYDATQTGYTHGLLIRSADPTTLTDAAAAANDASNTVTPHVLAGVTPLSQGGLIISSVAKDGTGAYSSVPGGMTQLLASNTNQGRWTGYYNALGTANVAVGPTNITPSAGDEYASITISVRPNYDAYHPPTPNPYGISPFFLQFLDDRYLGERDPGVAGPQLYLIDLAGNVTPAGTLAKADAKPLAGSGTPAGSIAKLISKPGLAGSVSSSGSEVGQVNKGLAGTTTPTGSLAKAISKALAGTLTPAGSLAKLISKPGLAGTVTSSGSEVGQVNKGLAGTETPAGALTRSMTKGFAGTVTPAGSLAKLIAKAFDGTVTPSGVLTTLKVALLTFTGTVTPAGSLVKQDAKALDASTSPAGSMAKAISKPGLAGTVTSSGSESGTVNKGLAGSVASSGALTRLFAKALASTTTPTATLAKFISKSLAGTETPAGDLSISSGNQLSLSGTVTPAGSLAKAVSKAVAGSTSAAGALAKLISKGLASTTTSSGTIDTSGSTQLSLAGTVTPAGALTRAVSKALAGTTTIAGALAKAISKPLAGSTTPSGALAKQTQKGLTSTTSSSGDITRMISKSLAGTVTAVGTIAKFIAKVLSGTMVPSGSVTLANPNAVTIVPGPFDAHWEICLDGPAEVVMPTQQWEVCYETEWPVTF